MLLRILLVVVTIFLGSTVLHASGQSTGDSANVDRKTRQQLEQTARGFIAAWSDLHCHLAFS